MPHTTFSASVAALLLDVFWKSLPVFALAGLACLLLRRASAAARHALWLLVLAGLLCLPVFCALLPRWAAPVLPAAPRPQVAAPLLPQVAVATPDVPASQPMSQTAPMPAVRAVPPMTTAALPPATVIASVSPALPPVPARPTLTEWVCLAWLVGASLVLGRTLLGLAAASRLVRRCRPVTAGPLVEAADHARRVLGLPRLLSVREGLTPGAVAVPMTCGVWRPVVLLPQGAAAWPADRLRAVLLHEAAHVRRWDWPTALLAQLVCALYWPHPLAWLAAHRLRAEAEGACDDLVLTHGGIPAPDYAAHLLEIVRGLAGRRASLPGTVAMASRPEVAARLRTILDSRRPRSGVTRRGLGLAALTALALLAPLAALRPVASDPRGTGQHAQVPADITMEKSWYSLFDPLHLASQMKGHSHWEVRFPDGTRIRLLSVAETDAHGLVVSSWTPDGRPQFHADAAANAPLAYGNSRLCQFAWGVTFASAQRQNEASLFYKKLGEPAWLRDGGRIRPWQNGQPYLDQYGNWFPRTQTQAALQVSVATGPKEVLIDATARTGGVRRLPTGEVVTVSPLQHRAADTVHEDGQLVDTRSVFVTLPTHFVQYGSEYELQTIGWDGKPFQPAHGGSVGYPQVFGKTAKLLSTYRTSDLANRVKEFRFTYRPAYSAVFRNVALRPAAAPAPAPPDPQAESPEKAEANRQASLANLRQIGLGLTEYEQEHYTHSQPRFPDAANWMDEIIPYLVPRQVTGAARRQRIAALFHDPAAPAGQTWSYAYNQALSGLPVGKVDSPASTFAVFESTKGTRNASDSGQSVPKPGWHTGGSDYLFTDGHTKYLRLSQAAQPYQFNPVDPNKPVAIPVTGRVYDRKTLKPVTDSSVIFSRSSEAITRGSVWPSSFTHKTGRFQGILYPGKNYLMILEGGRYVLLSRQPMLYETSGGTARVTTIGPAAHQYIINLILPNTYALAGESHPDKAAGLDVMAFVPVSRATLKPATGAAPAPQSEAQTRPDDSARFLAGLTAVQGPGIIVTLNDSKKPATANMHAPGMEPPNLIHDTDINMVVNELRAAGAEAIAVNGERLVAVSAVRSAGPTVLVNSTAQTPPYVVRAIGDIHTLQAALDLPHGVADLIRAYDPAMVKVQASAMLTLPPYRGGVPDRYARPVASADSSASLKAQEDRMVLAEMNKEVVMFAYKVKHPSRVHDVKRLTDAQMLVIMREQRAKAQAKVRRDRSGMSLMPPHVNVMPRTLREVALLTPPDLLPGLPQSPLLGGMAAGGHRPQLLPSPIYRGLLVTPPPGRRFSGLAITPPKGIRFLSDDTAH